jgi:prolyl-tRNA synthetase
MRVSQLMTKTLRETPAEADTVSHQLLLRAGMIHQIATGVYAYLPLGWKALRKLEQIVREELDKTGCQELRMPALQPLELWEKSGRHIAFGKNLFSIVDRRDRKLFLGPTHEEVITELARHQVRSYRDLPQLLYQIQTKFRDEPRPRGGLLRVREFDMMDLYSFDSDWEALDVSYQKVKQAYQRIYDRCGLPTMIVEADSGAIGGKDSQEFMAITDTGEDQIIYCASCKYAANLEKAHGVKPEVPREPPLPLEEVSTPGMKSIEEVSGFLRVPKSHTLKAVFYSADGQIVFVAIRGDLEVNEIKLKNALKCTDLRLATEAEVAGAGLVAGSASPLGLSGIKTVADDSVTEGINFVAGANRPDHHVKNVNYPRDFKVDVMLDIASAQPGQGCPKCGKSLSITRGIEVGHIFKLGTMFAEKLGAFFLDQNGEQKAVVMGSYGIGIGRLLATVIERDHDDKGIVWPLSLAPYQVYLCALGMDRPDVVAASEKLYTDLEAKGVEVLFDDRTESAGVRFNDADLLGMPLRVVVSQRTLKSQSAELKWRSRGESQTLPLDGLAGVIAGLLAEPLK